jgi:hypothetical protein
MRHVVKVSLDGGKTQRAIVKSCACGLNFTAHEWALLALVGTMMDPVESIELRNCLCGSTIAVEVPR